MKSSTHLFTRNISTNVNVAIDAVLLRRMQYLLYVMLIAFTSMYMGLFTAAHAGDLAPLAAASGIDQNSKLKDIMKQAGADFKDIGKTFADPAQADANAAKANELVDLFTLALQRTPDTIAKLAPADQAKAVESYQKQMKAMIVLCQKLAVSLQAKDSAGTLALLKSMKDGKQQGHDDFKPDDKG